MTLQFREPAFQRPSASEYAQQWGQSLNNLGDTFANIVQQKRQRDLQAFTAALQAKEQGVNPDAVYQMFTGHPAPMLPGTSAASTPDYTGFGSMNPSNQVASAGVSDVPSGPMKSTIQHWNDTMGNRMAPSQPMVQPSTPPRSIFSTPNVDVGDVMDRMAKGDYSGWQSASPYLQAKIQNDPRYKQMVKAQEERMVPVSHAVVLMPELKGRLDELNREYPNGIPEKDMGYIIASGMKLEQTRGEKENQFQTKRLQQLGDALDPSKQTRGAFSISKQVFDRAERLQSLANAFSDGNLDSRQIEELAIGLNSMLSGANTGAQHQVESLVPRTVWGNTQKLKEFLTNNPQGMQQQAFVQRMLGSVDREKQTALDQMNRTRYSRIAPFSDLERINPEGFYSTLRSQGVEPDEYAKWKRSGYKFQSAVQSPENSGSIRVGRFNVVAH